MASRKLRNRSYPVISQADSDHCGNTEDSNVNCSKSVAGTIVREYAVAEQIEQNVDIVVMCSDNVTICTDSNINNGSMQELLSALMQTIQSENCKLTAALEAKLTESHKHSAETAKQQP
jgi:tRNA threonylcarbamoyladenosine modification (KEOPS) complex Cgi121 subunit